MKEPSRRLVVGALIGGAPIAAAAKPGRVEDKPTFSVRAPRGDIAVHVVAPTHTSPPRWHAEAFGREALAEAALALRLADGSLLGPGAVVDGQGASERRGVWTPPFGAASSFDESCREIVLRMRDPVRGIRFSIIARAHDHGFAVRYRIDAAPGGALELAGEATDFAFPPGSIAWASRDEGEYSTTRPGMIDPVPDPPLTKSSDPGPMADIPLTVRTSAGLVLSVSESDRLDYPRLALKPGPNADSVRSHLMRFPGRAIGWSGPGDTPPELSFPVRVGASTPWRLVTVARSDAELVDRAGLPAVFASSSRIAATGWIRPGKAIRVRVPYTNARALECVSFARRHSLDYILFDAHWYGDGTDPSDATVPIAGLDMPRIVGEARSQGVGVFLYVDRVPAMRQLPDILRTYRAWGVAGVKFGFMWEGRQSDVRFINHLAAACGEAGLMVSLHDDLRPAGLERTWPNYVSLEGVRGNEHFPTARHNVTLAFTRCIAGPIDYTICYAQDRNRTTNAHQLAAAVVYYSPITLLYWYDEPSKFETGGWDALAWFDQCPTTWDETRALAGEIGEYVAIARRSGSRWFIGAMTNEKARDLALHLPFLKTGRWNARIFADGEPAPAAWKTPVLISDDTIDATDALRLRLAPSGGAAIILAPV